MGIKEKLAAKSAAAVTPRPDSVPVDLIRRQKTAPGQLMSSLPFLAEKEEEIVVLKNRLAEFESSAASRKIQLSELHEVEGRRRKLSTSEYNELKNNLKNHPIITPITVRKHLAGGYEIISGHNRVAVYRELGRDEIPAVIQDLDDVKSELGALFANLFHPSLPDIQKFAHFKRLKELTGKSHKELAEESGADPASITRWFSFEKLPSDALNLIYANPEKIGATAAHAFAQICEDKSKEQAVIKAIESIIKGELSQELGVKQAKEFGLVKSVSPKPVTENIKSGKFKYCKLVSTKETLRVDFETSAEREYIESTIRDLLKKRAQELSNK